jgi:hypothetical protein
MNNPISKLHLDILDTPRQDVFTLLRDIPKDFVLGGGTAIALQLNHRKSYDFDFFSEQPISQKLLLKMRDIFLGHSVVPVIDNADELTIMIDNAVKVSFIAYPFPSLHPIVEYDGIRLFDIRDLASNKAYTIGRRGVWRDYVDMFFLVRDGGLKLSDIIAETQKRFSGAFNPKLFLEQLMYFSDIDDFSIEYIGETDTTEYIQTALVVEVEKVMKIEVD